MIKIKINRTLILTTLKLITFKSTEHISIIMNLFLNGYYTGLTVIYQNLTKLTFLWFYYTIKSYYTRYIKNAYVFVLRYHTK